MMAKGMKPLESLKTSDSTQLLINCQDSYHLCLRLQPFIDSFFYEMGSTASTATPTVAPSDKTKDCKDGACPIDAKKPAEATDATKKLKPCCACPETKKLRDAW